MWCVRHHCVSFLFVIQRIWPVMTRNMLAHPAVLSMNVVAPVAVIHIVFWYSPHATSATPMTPRTPVAIMAYAIQSCLRVVLELLAGWIGGSVTLLSSVFLFRFFILRHLGLWDRHKMAVAHWPPPFCRLCS